MNFFRKMVNRKYDIKLDIPFSEFRKNPIKYSMAVRSKPRDLFVIKFKGCTKAYRVVDEHTSCSVCPMYIQDPELVMEGPNCCGLKHIVECNITVSACTHIGLTKKGHPIGLVSMDDIMEEL